MAPMETTKQTVEETSKQVGTFMKIMEGNPIALALVLMNILLMAFLFYSSSQTLGQRKDIANMIVTWQQATDNLMASCVSKEIMGLVLDALARAREGGANRALEQIEPVPTPTPRPRPTPPTTPPEPTTLQLPPLPPLPPLLPDGLC
jgi:hypothetical protein